eukprot:1357930-Prorocentrum_lima.AAC.1
MPSHQGNVPALTQSAGCDGNDYPMGGTHDMSVGSWLLGHGQGPEAQSVPQVFTQPQESHIPTSA